MDGYQAVFMMLMRRWRSSWRAAWEPGLAPKEITCACMQSMSASVEFPAMTELLSKNWISAREANGCPSL